MLIELEEDLPWPTSGQVHCSSTARCPSLARVPSPLAPTRFFLSCPAPRPRVHLTAARWNLDAHDLEHDDPRRRHLYRCPPFCAPFPAVSSLLSLASNATVLVNKLRLVANLSRLRWTFCETFLSGNWLVLKVTDVISIPAIGAVSELPGTDLFKIPQFVGVWGRWI